MYNMARSHTSIVTYTSLPISTIYCPCLTASSSKQHNNCFTAEHPDSYGAVLVHRRDYYVRGALLQSARCYVSAYSSMQRVRCLGNCNCLPAVCAAMEEARYSLERCYAPLLHLIAWRAMA